MARARAASAALSRVAGELSGARLGAGVEDDTMTAAQLLHRLNEDLNL